MVGSEICRKLGQALSNRADLSSGWFHAGMASVGHSLRLQSECGLETDLPRAGSLEHAE